MKKLVAVLALLVTFFGVVLAQTGPTGSTGSGNWAADYAAWKAAAPVETRFAFGSPSLAQGMLLVKQASAQNLTTMASELETTVFDTNATVNLRADAAALLNSCYRRQQTMLLAVRNKDGALALWESQKRLADVYKDPAFTARSGPSLIWQYYNGKSLVEAKFLSQDDADADLKGRWEYVPIERRFTILRLVKNIPAGAPADGLKYVKENARRAEVLNDPLSFLAVCYSKGLITEKDYESALKGVIIASIARMNEMAADDPNRQKALTAISKVKTSLKQLQEIEGATQ